MAIGYERARNLMRQLDWKMRVTMLGESVEGIEVYHPRQPNAYKVRMDSGRKLITECRVCGRVDDCTAVLCYDHDGSNESLI